MKHASILLLTIGLCGIGFAACAEGDPEPFGNTSTGSGGDGGNGGDIITGGKGGDGGKGTSSSSSSSSSSGGSVCSVMCSADADCQNNCSVPPVGINCCDIGTNTCYVSGADVCPSQGSSSGMMY